MGVVAGCVFLISMFLFIPLPFVDSLFNYKVPEMFTSTTDQFKHEEVTHFSVL